MGRAPCCDKAYVKKGPWSPEEDAKLKDYIEKFGTGGNWIALPPKIGLKRCGKSCRLRWLNYLRPNIKHAGFTEEEDNVICRLYTSIGSRWSIIAAQLPGRTDNDIKNYWNTRLKKKLLARRRQLLNSNRALGFSCNEPKNPQNLNKSALVESLQLYMHSQNLQNPFPYSNNPTLWSHMNPTNIHQKMIETLNSPIGNDHNNPTLSQTTPHVHLDSKNFTHLSCSKTDETHRIITELEVKEQNAQDQLICFLSFSTQSKLDDFLNIKTCEHYQNDSKMAESKCFEEMGGSKDNVGWSPNEYNTSSAPSRWWLPGSSNVLQDESGEIYHDHVINRYILYPMVKKK